MSTLSTTTLSTDLVVHPGEWFFGQAPKRISTLLGSCVAVTVWHPILRCGGMCHYLLTARPKAHGVSHTANARYGHDALQLLECEMLKHAPFAEYHCACFGGATMFLGNSQVGEANGRLAMNWLQMHGVQPDYRELGGAKGRKVRLDLANGRIEMSMMEPVAYSGEGNGH